MNTKKKTLAVLFGGHSSEYEVSLQSAAAVLEAVDTERFDPLPIGITKDGNWHHYLGTYSAIAGTWVDDPMLLRPAAFSPSRGAPGFWELHNGKWMLRRIDLAFPVLHGKNGEDGTVQGLFELSGIPLVGCGTLASALCMDKDRAHKLVSLAGIAVPKSVVLEENTAETRQKILDTLSFPVFVKPVRAGSSFGVTRVESRDALGTAVDAAFRYDSSVIVEEAAPGFEVGCAVLGTDTLTVGRTDEIELSGGFFDFEEKYTLKTSRIHMPARVDAATELRIQEAAKTIYRALGCSLPHAFRRVGVQRGEHDPRPHRAQPLPQHDERDRPVVSADDRPAAGVVRMSIREKIIDYSRGNDLSRFWRLYRRQQCAKSGFRRDVLTFLMSRCAARHGGYIGPDAVIRGVPSLPHGLHGVFISRYAVIGANCRIYQNVTIGEIAGKAPEIGDGCLIGAGAVLVGGIRVGPGAKIGAGAVVHTDVPAGATVVSPGARIIERREP